MTNYNAFISYSHSDCSQIAKQIHRKIESLGKPKFNGNKKLQIYRDEDNSKISHELWYYISQALDLSEYFILIASPEASNSYWVKKELEYWLEKQSKKDISKPTKNIIIVLAKGDIIWNKSKGNFDWQLSVSLPREILENKYNGAPYLSDLRTCINDRKKQKIRRNNRKFIAEVGKIVGTLTNQDPKNIISDELKKKRLTRFAVVIGFLILATTLVMSFLYKKQANTQGEVAENAKIIAETAKIKFKTLELNGLLDTISQFIEAEEFVFAARYLDSAKLIKNDASIYNNISDNTKRRMKDLDELIKKYKSGIK